MVTGKVPILIARMHPFTKGPDLFPPAFVSLDFTADYGSSHHDNMAEDPSDLYRIAREKMDAGDYSEAVRLFEASAAIQPHFKTLELLGECRIHLGLLREAVVPLAAATTLNIQPRAPALLADVLLRLGETDQATRIAQSVLVRNPTNEMALAVLRKLGACT